MKEKILLALKNARGQNTSTSDRTLETLAALLSKSIVDETTMPTDAELKAMIDDLNGNISHVAAEAVKNAKPTTPPVVPPVTPVPPVPPTDWKKEMEQMLAPIVQKIQGIEQAGNTTQMVSDAKKKFYATYAVSETERALCEKALDYHLKLNPTPESTDKLTDGWKATYEDLRSANGLGGLTPVAADNGGSGGANNALAGFKERMQKEGKIPSPQKQ